MDNMLGNESEAVTRCSVKKVIIEISQNSQESKRARISFLTKSLHACNCLQLY